jgi:hypothetical protein
VSVLDQRVTAAVQSAIALAGEVVLLHRLTHAAGRRDWFIIEEIWQLEALRESGRPRDELAVFHGRQLKLRAIADPSFARQVDDLLSSSVPGTEVVIAERRAGDPLLHDAEVLWRPAPPHGTWWHEADGDPAAWVREHAGLSAVAGVHPPLLSEDPAEILCSYWPGADGSISLGIY